MLKWHHDLLIYKRVTKVGICSKMPLQCNSGMGHQCFYLSRLTCHIYIMKNLNLIQSTIQHKETSKAKGSKQTKIKYRLLTQKNGKAENANVKKG